MMGAALCEVGCLAASSVSPPHTRSTTIPQVVTDDQKVRVTGPGVSREACALPRTVCGTVSWVGIPLGKHFLPSLRQREGGRRSFCVMHQDGPNLGP